MAKKKEKFPKQIFIAKEEADDNEYFVADESAEALSVQNDEREVGIYSLVRVAKIKNKTSIE